MNKKDKRKLIATASGAAFVIVSFLFYYSGQYAMSAISMLGLVAIALLVYNSKD